MMKLLQIVWLLLAAPCFAQVSSKKAERKALPAAVTFPGNFRQALTWKDAGGDHWLVLSESLEDNPANDGARDARLWAHAFVMRGDSLQAAWIVHDYVLDCPVDIRARFVPNTLSVTDLDHDGLAEVWMLYQTVCQGDVSPAGMKLIMYEGKQKHAVRGRTRVHLGGNSFEGGEYGFDAAFGAAPAVFRERAQTIWKKNILQKWD